MSRRGDHIRKRKDGRWEGRYGRYEIDKGRTIYISVYGKSYAEVKVKLKKAEENNPATECCPDNSRMEEEPCIKVSDVAQIWLHEMERTLKYSTFVKYKMVYEKHLKTVIGDQNLCVTDGAKLEELIETYLEHCYSKNIIISESLKKSIFCVINHILEYAERKYKICFPKLKRSKKGFHSPKNTEIFSEAEQEALVKYLLDQSDIARIGIYICLSTGLRLGEICALKWENINLKQRTIRVERTVKRITVEGETTKTILMETSPKSIHSIREIPISDQLADYLKRYGNQFGYLLCGDKPMEPRTYEKKLKAYLKACGIRNHTFHSLRHTFATNCINSGADIKTVSELLGHCSVQITLDKYVHPSMKEKRSCMEKLSAAYQNLAEK